MESASVSEFGLFLTAGPREGKNVVHSSTGKSCVPIILCPLLTKNAFGSGAKRCTSEFRVGKLVSYFPLVTENMDRQELMHTWCTFVSVL